ncbi:hypothetical protein BUALT_Bualt19G0106600 [Buddleja alternifolia]|uniref:Amino acid transporter transmembrane domain-containing protein n=1 Tax=Buddleja alternifolia TaxID=168488 RepID=A0AAV6WB93_9LAMI|nr:hypothetical protein BUALT_Bualt19G0106600 [Buddleja alternifolia]
MAQVLIIQSQEVPENQSQDRKCSILQTIFNIFNVMAGIGMLTTPYTVKQAGWLSLFILLLFAFICCYTAKLIKHCLESAEGIRTYADIAEAAFGPYGRILVSASCVEFVILEEDNLSKLFPRASLHVLGLHLVATHLFGILTVLIVLPTVLMRDMRRLSYVSAGGIVATVAIILCLLIVGTTDEVGFHQEGKLIHWSGISFAIGVYGYCYSGHPVLPSIYESMADKRKFTRVIVICFLLCAAVYGSSAVIGFLMFGQATKSQITLNLPHHRVASQIAIWTTVINPLTKYPFRHLSRNTYALLMNPLARSIEELLPAQFGRSCWCIVIIRTTLVVSTLFVTFLLPFFGRHYDGFHGFSPKYSCGYNTPSFMLSENFEEKRLNDAGGDKH